MAHNNRNKGSDFPLLGFVLLCLLAPLIFFFAKGLHSLPGMKVYVTDEKELIMEPSLKWAGIPVTIAVKAFGLKAAI